VKTSKKHHFCRRGFIATASLISIATGPGAAIAGAAESSTTAAANGSDSQIEQIIVTAAKREERAIDVPFSLQVVGNDDLTKLGAVDFSDYARTVSGVSFEDKGAGRYTIFMRGVSTGSDSDTGTQSSVGIYFDEVPISEDSSQPDIRLYDMERIEVLRGPQGTLFGSGSLSGTLRMLPKAPDPAAFNGSAGAQISGTEHGGLNYAVDGIANLPLSETSAARIVLYKEDNDGFLSNGFSGAQGINDEHTNGGRAAVLLRPTDNLDITLTGIYQTSSFGEYNQVTDHYPNLIIDAAEPEPFQDRIGLGTVKVNYDFGSARLTSVTSYYDRRRFFQNDIDYFTGLLGLPQAYSPLNYTANTVSQELRLPSEGESRLKWLVGGYFEAHHETALQSVSAAGQPVPPAADQLVNIDRVGNTRQYAVFGEANYNILPQLIFTAGVRASRIEVSNTSIDNGTLYGAQIVNSGSGNNSPVTPRAILSYKPNDAAQVYVQASKGFRIGGVNPGLPPCLAQNGCTVDVKATFGPDSVWNYEFGTKLETLGGRLALDADVFYLDWTDIQLNVPRGDGFNGFINGGKAVTKGIEFSTRAQLTNFLQAGGQFTYTEGRLTELGPGLEATGVAAVGDPLPAVPKISTSAFAELGTAFAADGRVYVRADVSYTTTRYSYFPSQLFIPLLPYALGNLRMGIDEGSYSASIFANNVMDRRAMLAVQSYAGVHDGAPYSWLRYNINVPRTIGLAFTRRF
jgi:outer membrane receptor protein involved in Fe transport